MAEKLAQAKNVPNAFNSQKTHQTTEIVVHFVQNITRIQQENVNINKLTNRNLALFLRGTKISKTFVKSSVPPRAFVDATAAVVVC